MMRLPFRFVLPKNLPPTYEYKHSCEAGSVEYLIEAVGTRSGPHFNKKTTCAFPVMPQDAAGATLRSRLLEGWRGETTAWRAAKNIRRGIWGDYSAVVMHASCSYLPHGKFDLTINL